MVKIEQSEYNNVAKLYRSGKSTTEIGIIYNVNATTILRILNKLNISLRNPGSSKKTLEAKKKTKREYKTKRRLNSTYRLTENLRRRVNSALNGENKSNNTMILIGCSIHELKTHLQETAIANGYNDFNIEDFSGQDYHIDHIIPCSKFDLSDPKQQEICFHYSNLQILDSHTNILKGDK